MSEDGASRHDFDEGFGTMATSGVLKELVRTGFPDLPAWVDSFDFVPASGLREIAGALEIGGGGRLLDLACGLGGPGLVVADHVAATLVGIDFSIVGVTHAQAVARGRGAPADYVAASGDRLPLRDASVDAVCCIDALGFIPGFALAELDRVVRPGGRVVVTMWERDVGRGGRPPLPDLGAVLRDGGLRVVAVHRRDQWLDGQRAVYEEALRRREAGDDAPAVVALAEEGESWLPHAHLDRRVLVIAERP